MAVLHNQAKNLRFFMELVDREVPAIVPGQPRLPPQSVRILGTTGVEFYDRRDQSFWPFIRLPVIYFAGADPVDLVTSLRDLCSLKSQGFTFRTGLQDDLVLQISRQEGGDFAVEVGIDLATYLLEASGQLQEPGRELAMFRYLSNTAELVIFADQLKQEMDRLPPQRG